MKPTRITDDGSRGWLGSCQWVPAALRAGRASRSAEDTCFPEVRQTLPQAPIATRSARGRERLHHDRAPKVRRGRHTAPGRPSCRAGSNAVHASARRFSTSARRSDRRWPFTARIFQALPRVAHRGGMASGRPAITGSPVGSPVLKLWNESRTNRARIADSLHVRFRSRPHIVADQSPTTKSCNRPDTIAAARASTR